MRWNLLLGLAGVMLLLLPARVPEDDHVQWSDMVWRPYIVNGRNVEHAALMVNVELDRPLTPFLMQLDLGTYASVLHRSTYSALRRQDRSTQNMVLLSGMMASRRFQDERFGFRPDAPETSRPLRLGTLGSSFFEDRVLLLDFVKQRLAILGKGAGLPPTLDQGVEFLPMQYRYGHILVTATVNGFEEPNMIFDTGASMIPLFTSHTLWTELTHRRPDDPANSMIRLSSWGKQVALIGAPVRSLCVGKACLDHPIIYYDGSGLPNMDLDRAFPAQAGLFGNVPFDGRFSVIVDIPRGRLGLLRGSLGAEIR